jgi:hypothetical protein
MSSDSRAIDFVEVAVLDAQSSQLFELAQQFFVFRIRHQKCAATDSKPAGSLAKRPGRFHGSAGSWKSEGSRGQKTAVTRECRQAIEIVLRHATDTHFHRGTAALVEFAEQAAQCARGEAITVRMREHRGRAAAAQRD